MSTSESNTTSPTAYEDAGNKPQTPRLRRSCEACRSTKAKCTPSGENLMGCQRCAKDGRQCVFLVAKARPKRAAISRRRVADMETRLDEILKLLWSSSNPPEDPVPKQQASLPAPWLPVLQEDVPEPPDMFMSPFPDSSSEASKISPRCSVFSNTSPMFPMFDTFNDVISKGLVSLTRADESLYRFRTQAYNFPFVILSPTLSLDYLRRFKPFLLLSILVFAEDSNAKLQTHLELELRETLSQKAVVKGERSLDILQGILVYLTWYYLYFDPWRQQIYQMTQMLATMAVDLEITKPIQQERQDVNDWGPARLLLCYTPGSTQDLEVKRTLLGCYYMSCSVCQSLRKPGLLKYNTYIDECAQVVAQAGQTESDLLLPHLIRLQRLGEDVDHAFDYGSGSSHPDMDAVRVDILVKSFGQRLYQCEAAFPLQIRDNVPLKMLCGHLEIYIDEISLHAMPPLELNQKSITYTERSWYNSTARTESLIRCLQASTNYLDTFLLLSKEDFLQFTLVDYLGLVHAMFLLASLATSRDLGDIDIAQFRQAANFEYYITALSTKATQAMSDSRSVGGNMYMSNINGLFVQSKVWYLQVLADPDPAGFRDGKTDFSFLSILSAIMQKCIDFRDGSKIDSAQVDKPASSDEQWVDLLSDWN